MELLECQGACASFIEELKSARERVLLLDYDGTLAPFIKERDRAFPYREIPTLLREIMAAGTDVALISGRPARELAKLSGFSPQPEIWGSYGLEHLSADGIYTFEPPTPGQSAGMVAALSTLQGNGFAGKVEQKPCSVAFHWRGLDEQEAGHLREEILQLWTPLAVAYGLRVVNFDGGIELCVPAADKGKAVRGILGGLGSAAVAFLGDDLTDEEAFIALKGKGLGVLVRPESRPTAADLWLKPPEELYQFLRQWLLVCGGEA
jgi:trehalose 6-phosphate phosphatase